MLKVSILAMILAFVATVIFLRAGWVVFGAGSLTASQALELVDDHGERRFAVKILGRYIAWGRPFKLVAFLVSGILFILFFILAVTQCVSSGIDNRF